MDDMDLVYDVLLLINYVWIEIVKSVESLKFSFNETALDSHDPINLCTYKSCIPYIPGRKCGGWWTFRRQNLPLNQHTCSQIVCDCIV